MNKRQNIVPVTIDNYVAAEKLVMLQERLDKPEFLRILEELSMSKR